MQLRPVVTATALAICASALALPVAGRAAADTRQCFFVGEDFVCVNVAPGGEGDAKRTSSGRKRDRGGWRTFRYEERDPRPLACLNSAGNASGVGVAVWVLAYYPRDASGEIITANVCAEPEERGSPPPLPPTPEEALAAAPLPEPVVHLSPDGEGVTGLETWLWGADYQDIPVTVTVRGYTVSGTARPSEWRWHMGDMNGTANPPPLVRASQPGSRDHPAARYTYETKGAYTVSHSVVWSGTFTVTGWGLSPVAMDAGEVTVDSSRPYTVVEIRAVRRTPDESR